MTTQLTLQPSIRINPTFIPISPWALHASRIDAAQARHRQLRRRAALVIPQPKDCPYCGGPTEPDSLRPGVRICTRCREDAAFIHCPQGDRKGTPLPITEY